MSELKPCDDLIVVENWQPIPGWNGMYEASDLGRIRSWYWNNPCKSCPTIRKQQKDKDGYSFVLLYSQGKQKGYRVSKLVLMAFMGIKEGYEASHLDGDKNNNYLIILKWETRKENENRKKIHGTSAVGVRNHFHRFNEQDIFDMRKMRDGGAKLKEIAEKYRTSETQVSMVCRRITWKHL